jgi:hypothetical protein
MTTEIEFAPLLTKHNATMDALRKRESETLQEFWNHVNPALTGKLTGPDVNWTEFHSKRNVLFSKWKAIKELQVSEIQILLELVAK